VATPWQQAIHLPPSWWRVGGESQFFQPPQTCKSIGLYDDLPVFIAYKPSFLKRLLTSLKWKRKTIESLRFQNQFDALPFLLPRVLVCVPIQPI
jgi:hypothetical protein